MPVSDEPILSQVLVLPDSPVHDAVDPAPKSPRADFEKDLVEELSKRQAIPKAPAAEIGLGKVDEKVDAPLALAEVSHTASVASTRVDSNPSSGRSTPSPKEATLKMLQAYEDYSYIKKMTANVLIEMR